MRNPQDSAVKSTSKMAIRIIYELMSNLRPFRGHNYLFSIKRTKVTEIRRLKIFKRC